MENYKGKNLGSNPHLTTVGYATLDPFISYFL